MELLLQASDISYAMQHWKVFQKWNEKLFREHCMAFDAGKLPEDPSEIWYDRVLKCMDTKVVPVAVKLKECGILGISSDECLGFAKDNREEWVKTGE